MENSRPLRGVLVATPYASPVRTRRVLIAEADDRLGAALEARFLEDGYAVVRAGTSFDALTLAGDASLAILDERLHDGSGFDVLARLRSGAFPELPVILLAETGALEPAAALEQGADDVLVKPFSHRELLARAKAVLRRSRGLPERKPVVLGALRLEPHRALVHGEDAGLSPSELTVLRELAANAGRAFTRHELLTVLGLDERQATLRLIDTHVASLRRKLGPAARCVETIRRYGYRFRD
jgi:DNA-binding response OmpR family regulator